MTDFNKGEEVIKLPELTYNIEDCHEGLIELFVDGKCLTEWVYEGDELDAINTFEEFKKVFFAGFKYKHKAT